MTDFEREYLEGEDRLLLKMFTDKYDPEAGFRLADDLAVRRQATERNNWSVLHVDEERERIVTRDVIDVTTISSLSELRGRLESYTDVGLFTEDRDRDDDLDGWGFR